MTPFGRNVANGMPLSEAKARMILAYWTTRKPHNHLARGGRNYWGDMAELELLCATNPGLGEKIQKSVLDKPPARA